MSAGMYLARIATLGLIRGAQDCCSTLAYCLSGQSHECQYAKNPVDRPPWLFTHPRLV